jgi:hypothetical protein
MDPFNSSERILELLRRRHADQDGPYAECEIANRVAASVRLVANPSFTSGNRQRARATSAS